MKRSTDQQRQRVQGTTTGICGDERSYDDAMTAIGDKRDDVESKVCCGSILMRCISVRVWIGVASRHMSLTPLHSPPIAPTLWCHMLFDAREDL